ncbi:hypothetical protein V6N11_003995 [Hibiscus sabdariffa]|uniref:RNase H type-1 domain-containing protein n=1 Tax=Hibiscus sabdariffa TaxID=183260 RepID=A0ABR2SFV1_9ROSI
MRSYVEEFQNLSIYLPHRCFNFSDQWQPPPLEMMKINFNASFSIANKRSCSGVVIRDASGQLLGSCSTIHHHVSSPFATEALASVSGLRFVSELGLHSIILEGDARHTHRSSNRAAHIMAQESFSSSVDGF